MQKAAIEKARDRLASAKARLKDLESAKDYDSSRRHWYDFLTPANSIFSILEQGAKGCDKSQNWFGKKKRERRTDPLLCYLHHARNADEHNFPSVTKRERPKIVMVEGDKPIAAIEEMAGNIGKFRHISDQPPDMKNVTEMRVYPDRANLITVTDRNVQYDPPKEHFGTRVDDDGPIIVAQLMMQYLEGLVAEAEALVYEN